MKEHAVLAVVTVLVIGLQLGCGLVLYDVGEVFWFADAIAGGLRPGVDYAVNAYGPGRYVLFAALFAVTGPSMVVAWALFLALRVAISSLMWTVARRYLPGPWSVVPVACLLVAPGPLHKGFYLCGTLLLVWALLRWLDHPTRRAAAVFGLTLAGVAAFRLDLGGFGLLASGLLILGRRERWRDLVVAWAPLAWGVGLVGLGLAVTGTLGPVSADLLDDIWKNQTIRYPRFPGPGRLIGVDADAWWLWSPIAIYGALAAHFLWAVRREGVAVGSGERRRLALLLLFGVLTCNQARMKPEYGHLLQAGPMLWLAASLLLWRLAGREGVARFALGVALAGSLVAGLALHTVVNHRGSIYTGSFTIPLDRGERLETRIGSVRLNRGEHAELAPTLAWLDLQDPGPVWVSTNQPLLHALSGREDVTGFVGVVYYADDAEDQRLVIDRLEARKPAIAVFVDDSIEGPERTIGVAAPRVHSYLLTNYAEVARHGRFRLMRRVGE